MGDTLRQTYFFLASLLTVALFFVACSGKAALTTGPEATATPSPGMATPTIQSTAAGTKTAESQPNGFRQGANDLLKKYGADKLPNNGDRPYRGGISVIQWPQIGSSFNPLLSGSNSVPNALMYDSVLTFEQNRGEDLAKIIPVPHMVESWEQPDATTYILRIRRGMTWQKLPPVNGRAITAKDIAFALEQYKTRSVWSNLFQDIHTLETPDDYTLIIKLKRPFAPLLALLSWYDKVVFPRELLEQEKNGSPVIASTPVGSGPFILESVKPDVKVVLRRNPDYWKTDRYGQQLPYLEKVVFLSIPEYADQVAAFRNGLLDNSSHVPHDLGDFRSLLATNPASLATVWPGGCGSDVSLRMKLEAPPFNDLRVRRALSMAIDRDGLYETVYQGGAMMANIVTESWLGESKTSDGRMAKDLREWPQWFRYDPEKAKALLTEAGYPLGFKTSLQMLQGPVLLGMDERAMAYVKADWAAIGVDVGIEFETPEVLQTLETERSWKGLLEGITGNSFDPGINLFSFYHSASPFNFYGPRAGQDPELDSLIEKQMVAFVPEDRRLLLIKAQERIYDQMHVVPIGTTLVYKLQQPWMEGMVDHRCAWRAGPGAGGMARDWINPAKAPDSVKNRNY